MTDHKTLASFRVPYGFYDVRLTVELRDGRRVLCAGDDHDPRDAETYEVDAEGLAQLRALLDALDESTPGDRKKNETAEGGEDEREIDPPLDLFGNEEGSCDWGGASLEGDREEDEP